MDTWTINFPSWTIVHNLWTIVHDLKVHKLSIQWKVVHAWTIVHELAFLWTIVHVWTNVHTRTIIHSMDNLWTIYGQFSNHGQFSIDYGQLSMMDN